MTAAPSPPPGTAHDDPTAQRIADRIRRAAQVRDAARRRLGAAERELADALTAARHARLPHDMVSRSLHPEEVDDPAAPGLEPAAVMRARGQPPEVAADGSVSVQEAMRLLDLPYAIVLRRIKRGQMKASTDEHGFIRVHGLLDR